MSRESFYTRLPGASLPVGLGCALVLLAACASSSGGGTASRASLRIDVLGFFAGARRATLECGASGGNVPRSAAACRAIASQSALLDAPKGVEHSCPAGTPTVFVAGGYGGRRVDTSFSLCVGGQEADDQLWLQLLGAVAPRSPVCAAGTLRAIVRQPISATEAQSARSQLALIKQAVSQGGRCSR